MHLSTVRKILHSTATIVLQVQTNFLSPVPVITDVTRDKSIGEKFHLQAVRLTLHPFPRRAYRHRRDS